MSEPIIRYENVSICQQGLEILEGINFELNKGEFVYLIGKVGSGKTSFLKTVYGELDIHSGEAEVMGYNLRTIKQKHIPDLRRRLGIVFQDFQLLQDRSVYEKFAKTRIPRIYISKDGIIRHIFTDDPVPSYDDLKSPLDELTR